MHTQPTQLKERRGGVEVQSPEALALGLSAGWAPGAHLPLLWLELCGLSPCVTAVSFSRQFLSFLQGPPGGGGPPGTPIMPSPAGKKAQGRGAFGGAGTEAKLPRRSS